MQLDVPALKVQKDRKEAKVQRELALKLNPESSLF